MGPDNYFKAKSFPSSKSVRVFQWWHPSKRVIGILQSLSKADFPDSAPRITDDGLILPN